VDKVTGKRVFQCRVVDMDPDLEGHSRETVVKILADFQPVPPGRVPFEPVEFENLVVTPYVNEKGRLAFSLRATGFKRQVHRVPKVPAMMPRVHGRPLIFGHARTPGDPRTVAQPSSVVPVRIHRARPIRSPLGGARSDAGARGAYPRPGQ